MRNFRKFSNLTDYNNYKSSNDYITPNVCLVSLPHKVMYNKLIIDNLITITVTINTITATASDNVASTLTISLTGDINDTITINSGYTTGTLSIATSTSSRTCNLSVSPEYDTIYNYVLSSSTINIPSSASHNLPSGYQELQYVSSDTRAAFKVNWNKTAPKPGCVFRCKVDEFPPAGTDWRLFGKFYPGHSGCLTLARREWGGATQLLISYSANSSSINQNTFYDITSTDFQEVRLINDNLTCFDGSTVSLATYRTTLNWIDNYFGIGCAWNDNISNFYFNSAHNGYYCKIGYLTLYLGTLKQYEFIPAKRLSDNKIGMYDLVNNIFHSSETGTEFIAGPPIN